ncbi:hypothetical protein PPERSA_07005 [Pseudocohnilembus persalinus]|uniref:Uncharacterized protein n=1 Tax=Pseudocohnilembus persalinus TaxID=266149 RepID=A0A0V0QYU1_PSEPJ|nr:hypothetical protein PPERSA_07005 [Pseudocohnilembus persalinus]|eukprot:KRX07390.1 hypothetical protein PPERSA_07005 [Pseudocohnilembus persalinus]
MKNTSQFSKQANQTDFLKQGFSYHLQQNQTKDFVKENEQTSNNNSNGDNQTIQEVKSIQNSPKNFMEDLSPLKSQQEYSKKPFLPKKQRAKLNSIEINDLQERLEDGAQNWVTKENDDLYKNSLKYHQKTASIYIENAKNCINEDINSISKQQLNNSVIQKLSSLNMIWQEARKVYPKGYFITQPKFRSTQNTSIINNNVTQQTNSIFNNTTTNQTQLNTQISELDLSQAFQASQNKSLTQYQPEKNDESRISKFLDMANSRLEQSRQYQNQVQNFNDNSNISKFGSNKKQEQYTNNTYNSNQDLEKIKELNETKIEQQNKVEKINYSIRKNFKMTLTQAQKHQKKSRMLAQSLQKQIQNDQYQYQQTNIVNRLHDTPNNKQLLKKMETLTNQQVQEYNQKITSNLQKKQFEKRYLGKMSYDVSNIQFDFQDYQKNFEKEREEIDKKLLEQDIVDGKQNFYSFSTRIQQNNYKNPLKNKKILPKFLEPFKQSAISELAKEQGDNFDDKQYQHMDPHDLQNVDQFSSLMTQIGMLYQFDDLKQSYKGDIKVLNKNKVNNTQYYAVPMIKTGENQNLQGWGKLEEERKKQMLFKNVKLLDKCYPLVQPLDYIAETKEFHIK